MFSLSLSYGGKLADLRFEERLTQEICGFAIFGLNKRNLRIWNLQTCIPQKFAIADKAQFSYLRFADFKQTFTLPPLVLAKHYPKRYAITAYIFWSEEGLGIKMAKDSVDCSADFQNLKHRQPIGRKIWTFTLLAHPSQQHQIISLFRG